MRVFIVDDSEDVAERLVNLLEEVPGAKSVGQAMMYRKLFMASRK